MKSVRYLTIITIVSIALLGGASVAQSPTVPAGRCRFFPKTGHYVCDKFLDFFETRGSLPIFGYPTTEAFIDPTHSGLRVQYFQRARMEEHPYNQPPYDVQLGLLVDELGHIYPPADQDELPDPDDASHHYFPQTQHVVSYTFLDFFRDHGGLDIFGYPRSEMVYEEGLIVQYFQRARMEWHHSKAPGQQIVLTNMGERYIERFDVPGDVEVPLPPPARGEPPETAPNRHPYRVFLPLILAGARPGTPPPSPIQPSPTAPSTKATELEASASVRYPITGQTGTQTAFIYVNDQDGRPIAGAEVTLTVHYQPEPMTCTPRPTDAAGFTRSSFDIPSPPVGERVVIDVTVTYEGLTDNTQTFFMPWW